MTVFETAAPLYTVYQYNEFVYRVVKWKKSVGGGGCLDRKPDGTVSAEERFSQSYSRSRSMILQYALCNKWDFFITITVNPDRFDTYDLDAVYKYLSQWFRDYRKIAPGFKYLLVPERHEKGGWHFHGFVSGLSSVSLSPFIPGMHPRKLWSKGYLNWPALGRFVGFCSLSRIKSAVGASFYITKYLLKAKEKCNAGYYTHLYFVSRGLDRARPVADFYATESKLEAVLQYECDFCRTGWAITDDWTFPISGSSVIPRDFEPMYVDDEDEVKGFLSLVGEQLEIAGWCSGNIPVSSSGAASSILAPAPI